jgi:hypothetical protein
MRRIWILGLLVGAFALTPSPAPADCAGPELDTDQRLVSAGDTIVVNGEFWVDGCQDSGVCACGVCDYGPEPRAYDDVLVLLKAYGRDSFHELGRVDANADGSLNLEATVPDVPPGRYKLVGQVGAKYRILAQGFVTVEKR